MRGILDRVADQWHSNFQPQTTLEFLALRLAQKLGEPGAAKHYLGLIGQHGEARVLAAYRRATASAHQAGGLARGFHSALERVNANGNGNGNGKTFRLLAIKVQRRSVAVAFFIGTQLDYTQIHHLPSAHDKAESSAFGFVNSMISHLKAESAALERLAPNHEVLRHVLSHIVEGVLVSHGLPVWTADKGTLLPCFGHPAPRSRAEVRKAICAIWPVLGPEAGILDAVALGLYIQTEGLFSLES